jgi:hypothetical protein
MAGIAKNLVCRKQVCDNFMQHANATRLHPTLPTFRHHSLFALGVVFRCRLFRPSGERLFVSVVERVGMFLVILDRVDS